MIPLFAFFKMSLFQNSGSKMLSKNEKKKKKCRKENQDHTV